MRVTLGCIGFLLMLITLGCGPDNVKSNDASSVLSGDSTVYGESDSSPKNSESSQDEEVTEDPTSYTDYDSSNSVESNDLDVSDTATTSLANLNWAPIYFDFDQAQITNSGREQLRTYAQYLRQNPGQRVLLEGHCDSRGTDNYNLALGERRAQAVKRYFMELGVDKNQLQTISYGELRPDTVSEDEAAWARNRRVSFAF